MKEKGRCYIYGSIHIKTPREDIIREILGRVDYVLLENFSTVGWRSLIRKRPSVTLLILGALTYHFILRMSIRIMDKWYRLKGKSRFIGDMNYVSDYAVKLGKRVEVADASLNEVFSTQLVNLGHILGVCNKIAVSLLIVIIGLIYVYIISGLYFYEPYFYVMVIAMIVAIILYIILKCFKLFAEGIKEFRDAKVIKRTKELVEMGYNVLIVRGKQHIEYLSNELRKHSIVCEVYVT